MFGSAAEARVAGYFSRRYQSRDDHNEAVEKHKANKPARPKQKWNPETKTWSKVK